MIPEKIAVARQMYASRTYTVDQIATTLGVTRGTIYQHLDRTAAWPAAPTPSTQEHRHEGI
jgi:hypothetical protein